MFKEAVISFDEETKNFIYLCPDCDAKLPIGSPFYYIADCTGKSYAEYLCRECKTISFRR